MDLSTCKKLILFGGSFDPPHNAHITLPIQACNQTKADGVIYIPAGNAPHKQNQNQTPAIHRLNMLKLALNNIPNAHILTTEIDNASCDQPTYTIDTLIKLQNQLTKNTQLHLLIGGDMLRIFNTWKDADKIIELAEPLVMIRPPDTKKSLLDNLPNGYNPHDWSPRLIDLPAMNISSSTIRQRVKQNLDITSLLHKHVAQYIREQELYR